MAIRNMNDIRAILCREIEDLKSGKTTPANVNAVCNATGKVISSLKLELEFAKLTNQRVSNTFLSLGPPLPLAETEKSAPSKKTA